jgi:hypothetical protein
MLGQYDYPRAELDFYPTPRECVDVISVVEGARVWEPACGDGAISRVLAEKGASVYSSDIKDYGYPGTVVRSFYDFDQFPEGTDGIITNPPYGAEAARFIEHGLKLLEGSPEAGMSLLLRNEYDCAKTRAHLFDHPFFWSKIVLRWRPRWIPDSTGGPRHNYAWYNWCNTTVNCPLLAYEDRPT